MASQRPPEPATVASMVEQYVYGELADAEKYDNRTPLDESGIYSLHRLAAEIYAVGWRDGDAAGSEREHKAARRREGRDA